MDRDTRPSLYLERTGDAQAGTLRSSSCARHNTVTPYFIPVGYSSDYTLLVPGISQLFILSGNNNFVNSINL